MKGLQTILGELNGRSAAALMRDGRLDDLVFDAEADGAPGPGAILRARCDRPLKGQGGMIVDLPGHKGFLRGAKGLAEGQTLLVMVTGRAEPGKAVPVTTRVIFKSRYAIITPDAPGRNVARGIRDDDARDRLQLLAHEGMVDAPEGFGLILRSAAEEAEDADIAQDIAQMLDLAVAVTSDIEDDGPELLLDAPDAAEVAWREFPVLPAAGEDFETAGVLDQLEALRRPGFAAGGATSYVEPTRALIAVDVNTGGDTSPAAALKANLAVARELPRQLRLRGLGGQVVIDVAPMPKKDRKTFEHALRAAFKTDPIETALVGWTPLGHFELQRKRERVPLTEVL